MVRIGIVFAVCTSILFAQATPFNQANITDPIYIYQSWVNYDTGIQTVNDVIHLRGGWDGFTDFCDQICSNASIVPGPSGKWYIYCYGDHKFSETNIGDAGWMFPRNADGKYDLVPNCRRPGVHCPAPVYTHMEPRLNVKPVAGYDWNYVGGMGQRMAVFYSPQSDARGNHYFALIKITHLGDPSLEPNEYDDDRHYLVWAVSVDGIMWQYEKEDPNFSDCLNPTAYLTDVSTNARPILYRECFQSDPVPCVRSNEVFHHYALFYSDPSKQDVYGHYGDGYLYVISGYTPTGAGIHNIVARIPFSLSSCIGRDLTKPIQIFRDDDPTGDSPYCPGTGRWQALTCCDSLTCSGVCDPLIVHSDFPGCIPLEIEQSFRSGLFNEFVPGMAVPFDWITLKDRWGNFYGSVLTYDSAQSFGSGRIAIRFTRDIRPPFRWTEERELNNCSTPAAYTTCEAGGNNVGLYQPPYGPGFYDYYDASTGAPKKLIAFFAHTKHNCCPDSNPACLAGGLPNCGYEAGGLLPATIELNSLSPLQEVQQVKVSKAPGGKLTVTWNPLAGVAGYEILEGTLGRYGPGGAFQPFGYPFNPDGYPGGTPCPETVKYDHYRKCPWKDAAGNCCTWRVSHLAPNPSDPPWYECCDDTACLGTPAEPITSTSPSVVFLPEAGARYILVSAYCSRYDQETYGFSSAGTERPAPLCGPMTCYTPPEYNACADTLSAMQSNIDCYHYYYQGWGQPYNYGLNHWPQLP